jgi:hypothetical protein
VASLVKLGSSMVEQRFGRGISFNSLTFNKSTIGRR